MKARHILTIALAAGVSAAMAYDIVKFNEEGIAKGINPKDVKEITLSADKTEIVVTTQDGTDYNLPRESTEITFGTSAGVIAVNLDGSAATIDNPLGFSGVEAAADGAHVTVTANSGKEVEIAVSGTTTDGAVKVYGSDDVTITLSDATITNASGAAVNVQSKGATTIKAMGTNSLTDAEVYSTPSGEKEKATIYTRGSLTLAGSGSLTLAGNNKHGICSEGTLTVESGSYKVTSAASDALHGVGIVIEGGYVETAGTVGDGLDADTSTLTINGGSVKVTIPTADTKGIKADDEIAINGGVVTLDVPSDQSKGIKSKSNIRINGGTITANTSGNAVVVDGDPSYCTVVKADADVYITNGSLTFKTLGKGGKGIFADGNLFIEGGTINIDCEGNGEQYVDTTNTNDVYSSTCITIDGNAEITGGELTLLNNGSAGKCLKVDCMLTLGSETSGPTITAEANGVRIQQSSSSTSDWGWGGGRPGGGPGGGGGGGWEEGGDYSNPKAIKATGDLVVNSGSYKLKTSNNGGEGLESKANLTINGGTLDIDAYDDAINGGAALTINGGVMRCLSVYNDAIDSNGTFVINGGVVIAESSSTQMAEEALDCDTSIKIKGGIIFGIGSNFMSSFSATQPSVKYSGKATGGTPITISGSDGAVISYTPSKTFSTGKMIISSPLLKSGTQYTISTGGTVSGGTDYFTLTSGGTLSGGTTAKTYTQGSALSTVN